jgi:predicted GTPase
MFNIDPTRLHFAVCGFSGTGKSSLINAVRGLANHDDGTAPTGVVETTMNIQRYPDTRKEDPFPRFVWFDVPGGGGAKITDWQYFNNQGLFIFDVILVVYDTMSVLLIVNNIVSTI